MNIAAVNAVANIRRTTDIPDISIHRFDGGEFNGCAVNCGRGDIADIAALVAPRPVTINGGITGEGKTLDRVTLNKAFASTKQAFELLDVGSLLVVE